MNTKILMAASALFLGILGLVFSFFPQECLMYLEVDPAANTIVIVQILGSFYLGFGMLN